MKTLMITWFQFIKDVEDILKYLEKTTNYRWASWPKPTSDSNCWKLAFDSYQTSWWFCLTINTTGDIRYGFYNSYSINMYDEINFKDLIKWYE